MHKSQPTTATSPKIGRSDLMLYIADHMLELKKLAREQDAGVLVALLGMVQHEAAREAALRPALTQQGHAKAQLTS
jgi:hypothetical protein